MSAPRKFDAETRERAVRMYHEHLADEQCSGPPPTRKTLMRAPLLRCTSVPRLHGPLMECHLPSPRHGACGADVGARDQQMRRR